MSEETGTVKKTGKVTLENFEEYMMFTAGWNILKKSGKISSDTFFDLSNAFLLALNERDGVEPQTRIGFLSQEEVDSRTEELLSHLEDLEELDGIE